MLQIYYKQTQAKKYKGNGQVMQQSLKLGE